MIYVKHVGKIDWFSGEDGTKDSPSLQRIKINGIIYVNGVYYEYDMAQLCIIICIFVQSKYLKSKKFYLKAFEDNLYWVLSCLKQLISDDLDQFRSPGV